MEASTKTSEEIILLMTLHYMRIRGEKHLIDKCFNEVEPMISDKNNIKKHLCEIELYSVSGLFMKDLKDHLNTIFENKLNIQYI